MCDSTSVAGLHDVFRRPRDDDAAAVVAGLGAQVDDPVGRLDHVEVVLDDDHRVAQIDQAIEHVEQLANVVEVQARRRLVEQVQRPPGAGPGQLGRQLDALGLAAGQRRRRLAQREVVEADVGQRLQHAANLRDVAEQLQRLADAHLQHVGDGLALVAHGQRLGVVAAALADVALDPDVGQEVHLDLLLAVALARLAAAARLVEAEALGLVAAHLRLGQLGEQLADQVEDAGVGRRVGAGRIADRVLIDVDDLVDVLEAEDVVVSADGDAGAVQLAGQGVVQDLVDQRTLARAADAGDGDEGAEREGDVDVLQVVLARPLTVSRRAGSRSATAVAPARRQRRRAIRRHRDRLLAGQVLAGQRVLGAADLTSACPAR